MSPDAADGGLLADAAERARRYLAGLDHRPVAPDPAALSALGSFDEPLPEEPGDPAATLRLLDEAGSPATVASAGGRYFGFVTGGSLPVAVAASWPGRWESWGSGGSGSSASRPTTRVACGPACCPGTSPGRR